MADVTEVSLSAAGSSAQLRTGLDAVSDRCPLYPRQRTCFPRNVRTL